MVKEHAERGIHIDPHTARTHWRGETMDYGIAIDVLLGRERRTARETAALRLQQGTQGLVAWMTCSATSDAISDVRSA